jgi:hypothetical protein
MLFECLGAQKRTCGINGQQAFEDRAGVLLAA